MPIPDYQTIMLPFLKIVADGKEHTLREIINGLAEVLWHKVPPIFIAGNKNVGLPTSAPSPAEEIEIFIHCHRRVCFMMFGFNGEMKWSGSRPAGSGFFYFPYITLF